MSSADGEEYADYNEADEHDPSSTAEVSPDADDKSRKRTREGDFADCDEGQKLSRGEQDTSASRASNAAGSIDPNDLTTFSSSNGLILAERAEGKLHYKIIPEKVGHIIGSKGMIIVDIMNRSKAQVIVNQNFEKGENREITITGTEEQILAAADLIKRIVDFGPTAIHENSLDGGPPTTKMIHCSQAQVGKVIGGGGANIKEIQSRSGAKVQVEQNFPPEVPREIHISGSKKAVEAAEKLIQNILAQTSGVINLAPNAPEKNQSFHRGGGFGGPGGYGGFQQGGHGPRGGGYGAPGQGAGAGGGPEVQKSIEIPKAMVGKIMGKGAETLRLVQNRSGCRVNIDQNVPEGVPCKVNISGSQHNVNIAMSLVQELLSGVHFSKIGGNLPPPAGGFGGGFPHGGAGYGMPFGGGMPGYGMGMGGAPGYGYGGGYGNPMYNAPPAASPYPMGGGYQSYGAAAGGAAPSGYGGAYPGAGGYGGAAAGYGGGGYGGAQAQHHGAPPAAKSKWTEHKTEDGTSYWYNASTQQSQWEKPKDA